MRFEIEVKETVEKINTYVIKVEDEEEGEAIAHCLEDDVDDAQHPDEIIRAFKMQGVNLLEIIEGAEEVRYEVE